MPAAEHYTSSFDRICDLDTVLNASCQWLLAQDVETFFGERGDDLVVHGVLDCDHDGIGETAAFMRLLVASVLFKQGLP